VVIIYTALSTDWERGYVDGDKEGRILTGKSGLNKSMLRTEKSEES